MRKTILLIALTASVYSARGQWTQLTGLEGGNIVGIVTVTNSTYIAATQYGGVYVTNNHATSWAIADETLVGVEIRRLAWDYSQAIAALATSEGVYISDDNGESWTLSSTSLTSVDILDIKALPGHGFVCGTPDGVFLSNASVTSWTAVNTGLPSSTKVYDLSVDAIDENSHTNWLAATDNGLFYTSNSGGSWAQLTVDGSAEQSFDKVTFGLPDNDEGLITSTELLAVKSDQGEGIFFSDDLGDTWTVTSGADDLFIHSLFNFSGAEPRIYAATSDGVLVLNSAGDTFAETWSKPENPSMTSIAIGSDDDGLVWLAGTTGGIYKSPVNPNAWTAANSGLVAHEVTALLEADGIVYAGTNGGGVYISGNNGATWVASNSGFNGIDLSVLALFDNNGTLLAGTTTGVYQSDDEGATWTKTSTGLSGLPVSAIVKAGANLYTLSIFTGVYKSTDGGDNWAAAYTGLDGLVLSLGTDGTNLYASSFLGSGAVFRSTDGAANWAVAESGITNSGFNAASAFFPNTNGTFAATSEGLFFTADGGDNWTEKGTLPDTPISFAEGNGLLYVSIEGSGVYTSDDDGTTFSAYNTDLANLNTTKLLYGSEVAYVGTKGGGIWKFSTAIAPEQPDPVTFGTVTAASVEIIWTAPNDNGSAITGYSLEQKTGAEGTYAEIYSGTDFTHTATGLNAGDTYYFRVKATNAAGDSDFSEESYETTISEFTSTFGGDDTEVLVKALALADGGYLLVGYSDSGATGNKSATSRGGYDYWLVKVDSDGNKVWDKAFGGNNDDILTSFISLSDGGFLLSGNSSSGANGDKTQGSKGGNDFWVIKVDSDFEKVWDKTFGTSGNDLASTSFETTDGALFLGGYSTTTDGDRTASGVGSWLIKLDASGNKIWDKSYRSTIQSISTVFLNYDDEILSLAAIENDLVLGGHNFLLRIGTEGDVIWAKNIEDMELSFPGKTKLLVTYKGVVVSGTKNKANSRRKFIRLFDGDGEIVDSFVSETTVLSQNFNDIIELPSGALIFSVSEQEDGGSYLHGNVYVLDEVMDYVSRSSFGSDNKDVLLLTHDHYLAVAGSQGDFEFEKKLSYLKTFYADVDSDGFGNAASPHISGIFEPGYTFNDFDCDDSDNQIEYKVWYYDYDGDGYGNLNNGKIDNCIQPNGYVDNADDCEDGDNQIHPTTIWYADDDDDGFGNILINVVQCSQPDGYVLANTDCDDDNANENPDAIWYADADDDGYGDSSVSLSSCTQPDGYILDDRDCDDSDNSITISTWYEDNDGDGFGDASSTTEACSAPTGFVGNNTDCNDLDEAINPDKVWYLDNDEDGFGDPASITTSCTQPTGYVENADDCDDDDALNPPTWYQDADGDGDGDPDNSLKACSQPSGYVSNSDDCDDTDDGFQYFVLYQDLDGDDYGNDNVTINACELVNGYSFNGFDCDDANALVNPFSNWYLDEDGDGFGVTESTIVDCEEPAGGYVLYDGDCNDADPEIHPETTWYKDNDGDGYGQTSVSIVQCEQPSGYALLSGDCNDFTEILNPGQIWYYDSDGDGYGTDTNTITHCGQSPPSSGYKNQGGDCDDQNDLVNPGVQWFLDTDGDGSGDPDQVVEACYKPDGYVSNEIDCDDTDPLVPSTWYYDNDNDGYGSDSNSNSPPVVQCEKPGLYVSNNDDCNDQASTINPMTIWYADEDADGWGNANSSVIACNQPSGFVSDSSDCDDTNSTITTQLTTWYADADGDGYGDFANITMSCPQPDGYVNQANDCDDGDAELNPETIWYRDVDGDGFGNPDNKTTSCDPGGFYVRNFDDCNDFDGAVNPEAIWYADADGDGFGDASKTKTGCTQPEGYVLSSTDCDDTDETINPNKIWYRDNDGDGYAIGNVAISINSCDQPEGYTALFGDCDDTQAAVSPETIWYLDADADGFGDATKTMESCTQPSGYSGNSSDCDDANAAINPNTLWYLDNDGDGYAIGNTVSPSVASCTQPVDYVAAFGDCDDALATVYPGAPAQPDGLDNNCDGIVDKGPQTISFDEIAETTFTTGLTINMAATASSGLPVTFSSSKSTGTVSGSVLSIQAPGEYIITAVQAGNEFYEAATEVSRTFCVNPPALVISQASKNSISASLNLPGAVYDWYLNDELLATDDFTLTISNEGTYTLKVIADGCQGEFSNELEVSLETGIEDLHFSSLQLYPNPVENSVSISFESTNTKDVEVILFSVDGLACFENTFSKKSEHWEAAIDLRELPAGLYFVRLSQGDQHIIRKLLKN